MNGRATPHRAVRVLVAAAGAALLLAACSSTPAASRSTTTTAAAGGTTSSSSTSTTTTSSLPRSTTSTVAPPAGLVVAPADIDAVVANDTTVNNEANASLSVALQDSHETCLQDEMDDLNYGGTRAAGQKAFGAAFTQVPTRPIVPRQSSYPAQFSVLVSDEAKSTPTTTDLLTYTKVSAGSGWKLAYSSEILGPTSAGVAVPAVRTDSGGYATALDPSQTDGLTMAPDAVAARVASAFDSEATSGQLPAGITAQFGAQGALDPHATVQSAAQIGSATVTFTTTPPVAVAPSLEGAACALPAYRLADGGALVTFALFQRVALSVSSSSGVAQPSDRGAFGDLLPPGTYTEVTTVSGDVCVAIVPPAGSSAPLEVIGQAPEGISAGGAAGGEITT